MLNIDCLVLHFICCLLGSQDYFLRLECKLLKMHFRILQSWNAYIFIYIE